MHVAFSSIRLYTRFSFMNNNTKRNWWYLKDINNTNISRDLNSSQDELLQKRLALVTMIRSNGTLLYTKAKKREEKRKEKNETYRIDASLQVVYIYFCSKTLHCRSEPLLKLLCSFKIYVMLTNRRENLFPDKDYINVNNPGIECGFEHFNIDE